MKPGIHKETKKPSFYLMTKNPTKFKCAKDDKDDDEELIIPEDSVCIIDIDESGDCVRIWPDLMDLKSKTQFPKINAMRKHSIINQRQFIR